MPKLASICVPAFNAAPYLRQCLDSALAQTFEDFELVLVDNASTDATFAIAAEYARRDSRIRLYKNDENLGPETNFNRCIDLAQGEWLKFLCADDWLEPTCLARMLAARRPHVLVVVCSERLAFPDEMPEAQKQKHLKYWADHSLLPRRFPGQSFVTASAFARLMAEDPTFNCIGAPNAIMLHRAAFQQFGRRVPCLRTHDDWELSARVAVHTGLCFVDAVLANFRQHPGGLSITEHARHRFSMEVIAPLIIRHEVAYAPVYAPVREAAMRCSPPINLEYQLLDALRGARGLVDAYANHPSRPDPNAREDWNEVTSRYPRLLSVPASYYVQKSWHHAKRKLQRAADSASSWFAPKSSRSLN